MQLFRSHTDSPGTRFIDPLVLARIDNLEMLAKTVVEGFLSGLHRAPYLGMSIDFAEHRAYMPGDDIRRIDWRLFGRTDRFYVKEFEADTNTNFSVLVDVSRSMDFATAGHISKLDYARFLAASLVYLSRKQRDRVGMVTFDSDIVDMIPPSAKHMEIILHTLDRTTAGRGDELKGTILKIAETFRRRSIIVLISDFYEEPDAVLEAVNTLRYRGNDMIVFHVLDPAELTFSFEDAINFEDLETGERLSVVPEALRAQYQQMLEDHIAALDRKMGENQIDYTMCDTSAPLDVTLFRYLSHRQRMSRVR